MSNDLVIIACPPYPKYKEAPTDQSHCELFQCTKCKEQMWMSEKKKGVLMFSSCIGKEILLGCYDCIKKIIESDPSFFTDMNEVNL